MAYQWQMAIYARFPVQGFLEFAPANAIFRLPLLVRSIIDSIFVIVISLMAYSPREVPQTR
jgi:hypothetical protein